MRRALALSLVMLLGSQSDPRAQQADYQPPPDLPYTAIVTGYSARFVFPIPYRDRWRFDGPSQREVVEYEWSVTVENDGARYVLGLFVTTEPNQLPSNDARRAPIDDGRLRLFSVDPSGVRTDLTSRYGRYLGNESGQNGTDKTRLVVYCNDRKLLRLLFYDRPAHVTFTERYFGEVPVTHDVQVQYDGFLLERPLPAREPTWTRNYETLSYAMTIAPGGACFGIVTDKSVEVIDRRGRPIWTWNYRAFNRFLGGPLAIAPSCDVIAFGGGSGYPYTWIVNRNGQKHLLHVSPVPRSLAFDGEGKRLAIGTGYNFVYLFTASGQQLWKADMHSYYVGSLEFSDDNQHIVVNDEYGIGVLNLDGTVAWNRSEMEIRHYTPNLDTFLTFFETMHGEYTPRVAAYDGGGRELWSKGGEACTVDRSGGKIVANVDGPKIFSRTGDPIASLPAEIGCPMAFHANDQHFITNKGLAIEEVDLQNRRFWSIPVEEYSDQILPFWTHGNLEGILISKGGNGRTQQLAWYELN